MNILTKLLQWKSPGDLDKLRFDAHKVDGLQLGGGAIPKPPTDVFVAGAGEKSDATAVIGGTSVSCSQADLDALSALSQQDSVPLNALPPRVAFLFAKAWPQAALSIQHPGLTDLKVPWNAAALMRLSAADAAPVSTALLAYAKPEFIRSSPEEKRAVIDALTPLLTPEVKLRLEKWHLPRPAVTSTAYPVTLALESETSKLSLIYGYYAPDPTGKLDIAVMPEALKKRLLDGDTKVLNRPRTPIESRMSDDSWLASLRWKDLRGGAQHAYLQSHQQLVDKDVKLHRITDARQAPFGEVAPATLQETLKWERELKLQMAELITASSYPSLDVQQADREWISTRFESAFHLHAVVELTSAEDKERLGPKVSSYIALQDLGFFAFAAGCHEDNYTHSFLEPWKGEYTTEVANSFSGGTIDADALLMHKFHYVGIRSGIYGQDDRLGIELRGGSHTPAVFDHATQRVVELLSGGGIEKLPSPPWPGWDAGEKSVGKVFEEQARKELGGAGAAGAELVASAKLSFDEVMEVVVIGSKQKNGFAYSAPLWTFEAVPGLNDAEKKQIGDARRKFMGVLLDKSAALSAQIELGRDLNDLAPELYKQVITAAMTFFREAGVHLAVERVLNEAAGMPNAGAPVDRFAVPTTPPLKAQTVDLARRPAAGLVNSALAGLGLGGLFPARATRDTDQWRTQLLDDAQQLIRNIR